MVIHDIPTWIIYDNGFSIYILWEFLTYQLGLSIIITESLQHIFYGNLNTFNLDYISQQNLNIYSMVVHNISIWFIYNRNGFS